jgi:hypothetical protein
MRLLRRLAFDLLFLWRYGFVYAYLFVLLVYGAVLSVLPQGELRLTVSMAMVYSDIAMLGFLFMGASLHLEVDNGTAAALGITSAEPVQIIAFRVLAMSLASTSIALLLILAGGGRGADLPLFLIGAASCAATFSCFGISLMSRTGNLARFLVFGGVLTLPMAFPLIFFLGGEGFPPAVLLPGAGGLGLMCAALPGISWEGGPGVAASAANILLWGAAALFQAARDFRRRVIEARVGGRGEALR